MNYKIYGIKRFSTDELIYIGLTKNSLSKRMNSHLNDKRRNPKKYNYFVKYKEDLSIFLIEENIPNLEKANELEVFYIEKFINEGFNLLNATKGGDGTKGVQSWNKGLKCNYIDKLKNNSPRSKKVYSYNLEGNFIKEYNSIKSAHIETNVSRTQIIKICEMKSSYKQSKGYMFRFFKSQKIDSLSYDNYNRINKLKESKLNLAKKILIYDKEKKKEIRFVNYLDCINNFNIKKSTLHTYLSIGKDTKKYKFSYE